MVSGGSSSAATSAGGSNSGSAATNSGGGSGFGLSEGGVDDSCAADVSTAKLVPLDIYMMLDISSSMLDLTATNVSKWDAVKGALETFLKDGASAGIGVGLQYFPLINPNAPTSCTSDASCGDSGPCFLKFCQGLSGIGLIPCEANSDCSADAQILGDPAGGGACVALTECSLNTDYACPNLGDSCLDPTNNKTDIGTCRLATTSVCEHTTSCDVTAYATPAQAIATLPGAAATLVASIDGTTPNGVTPTAPALAGAIQQATAWAKAHPDHRVVTLLATDGMPTECTPTDIGQVAAIAAAGLAATPSIETFVIGVFGPADVAQGAPDNLNQIAAAGGNMKAFIVDTTKDVSAQFLAALDAIRGGKLDCSFQIPQPSNGKTLVFQEVNVDFSSSGHKSRILYVKQKELCDSTTGGWYYDVDPDLGTPTQIIACPTTCSTIQSATDASVEIALGCQTSVK
jgi:hypothetical protein